MTQTAGSDEEKKKRKRKKKNKGQPNEDLQQMDIDALCNYIENKEHKGGVEKKPLALRKVSGGSTEAKDKKLKKKKKVEGDKTTTSKPSAD